MSEPYAVKNEALIKTERMVRKKLTDIVRKSHDAYCIRIFCFNKSLAI